MKITLAHGSGGKSTSELIDNVFAKAYANPVLSRMEDSAVVPGSGRIAVTTDSFVVTPIRYPGGDIGRLAVCGTVNDLLMSGAEPKYLTCGFILEEGADTEDLQDIARSMAATAKEAGVLIVAGDTKVVNGTGEIYINTAGVGFVPEGLEISSNRCRVGDKIILSGSLGDHHAAILSRRMGIENEIVSDCAPLCDIVNNLKQAGVSMHAMRDVTRGGLGTVLNEFARASGVTMELREEDLPVSEQVRAFCKLLGLDPMYMGNEGKMIAVVPEEQAETALKTIRQSRYGAQAAIIGQVTAPAADSRVVLHTRLGGKRVVDVLHGEGLPRIC